MPRKFEQGPKQISEEQRQAIIADLKESEREFRERMEEKERKEGIRRIDDEIEARKERIKELELQGIDEKIETKKERVKELELQGIDEKIETKKGRVKELELQDIDEKLKAKKEKLAALENGKPIKDGIESEKKQAKKRELEKARGAHFIEGKAKEVEKAKNKEKEKSRPHVAINDDMHEVFPDDKYLMTDPKEMARDVQKIMAEEEAIKEAERHEDPDNLIAIGVDWSRSEESLARDLARKDLESELKTDGIIKRIWKGKIFRNLYEETYKDEYLDGDRVDDEGRTIFEIIDQQKKDLMGEVAGEVAFQIREQDNMKLEKRLIPVDEEINKKIKSTIEDYAVFMNDVMDIRPDLAKNPEFTKEVDNKFNSYMARLIEEAKRDGKIAEDVETNNYLEVAKEATARYREIIKNAKDKIEQDAAMAKVTAGFQAYNIITRKKFSRERETNIDRVIRRVRSSYGNARIVPAETFFEAVDEFIKSPEEAKLIDSIKKYEELLGGEEGVEIMMDKGEFNRDFVIRCQKWWNGLSSNAKAHVDEYIKNFNAYPDRYKVKWGNSFRTWYSIRDLFAH